MKKLFFIAAAVVLLAAGCSSQQSAQNNPTPGSGTPPPVAQSNIKVNSADDAVNALESNASSEQSVSAGTDDSTMVAGDQTDLDSYTGVTNGF